MLHPKNLFLCLVMFIWAFGSSQAQQSPNQVKIVGAMKNAMWKGELLGNIHLDTISDKQHLYGLGPVEYLTGEILVMDGKSYKSSVISDTTMKVEQTFDIKAPFFGYAHIPQWAEHSLPEEIQTIDQLEVYLDKLTENAPRPFLFKLIGMVEDALIHIVNLPEGAKVSSPDEAHQGQVNYLIHNQAVEILGFFSTQHQAVFTHHDTWVHLHLITADKQKMGHLDKVVLKKGSMKLYLPQE